MWGDRGGTAAAEAGLEASLPPCSRGPGRRGPRSREGHGAAGRQRKRSAGGPRPLSQQGPPAPGRPRYGEGARRGAASWGRGVSPAGRGPRRFPAAVRPGAGSAGPPPPGPPRALAAPRARPRRCLSGRRLSGRARPSPEPRPAGARAALTCSLPWLWPPPPPRCRPARRPALAPPAPPPGAAGLLALRVPHSRRCGPPGAAGPPLPVLRASGCCGPPTPGAAGRRGAEAPPPNGARGADPRTPSARPRLCALTAVPSGSPGTPQPRPSGYRARPPHASGSSLPSGPTDGDELASLPTHRYFPVLTSVGGCPRSPLSSLPPL